MSEWERVKYCIVCLIDKTLLMNSLFLCPQGILFMRNRRGCNACQMSLEYVMIARQQMLKH
jgi:hypothetical protein